MSRAVQTLVAVVAAVAIPFVAPMIASSIGMSAAIGTAVGSATAGSVIGGAVVGAGLGAAKAAVFGEDVGKGALYGGLGGGIGGYTAAPTAAPAAAGAPPPVYDLTSAGLTPAPGYTDYSLTAGLTAPPPAVDTFGAADYSLAGGTSAPAATGSFTPSAETFTPDYSLTAGVQMPSQGLNPATAGFGLRAPDPGFYSAGVSNALATGTPIDYSLGAYTPPSAGLNMASVNPVTGGMQVTTGGGTYQSVTPAAQYSGGSYVGPTGSATGGTIATGGTGATATPAPATPASSSFMDKLKQVPGEIAAKFTDPKNMADITLRAAGMLAGSAIAGDGLSDQERTLVEQQTQELRALQQTNRALFDQRLEQAQNLVGESKYFDPEYFGLQRARRAQLAGAKAKRAGLRGLEGGARISEGRRFDLATARDTGTAYDVGYGTGVQGRLGTMQAGMQMMPQSAPSASAEYAALQNVYGNANTRARERQKDIGGLFGSLTGG